MTIQIDRNIYSDIVISKVVYWLSGKYIIKRKLLGDVEELDIKVNEKDSEISEEEFYCLLNDYKLRELVATETKGIKTILYAKAFADDENFSEDDIKE